ncbi:hypothetical protein [Alkanindiges illinoisensis]|uniref:hypothetical protein n=1 Tax=Alkanindiges illinoisensis TaxID=197183 RepID=UPI00047E4DCA|nr:hypothetical protein [Alkanindiges illinoisensis]
MRNLAVLFLGITLSATTYAEINNDELAVLKQSENDSIQQSIGEIERQADTRLKQLEELGSSVTKKNIISSKNEPVILSPEEYKNYGIEPFYTDSEIAFYKEAGEYLETKEKNNILMSVSKSGKEYVGFFGENTDDYTGDAWSVSCSKDRMTDKKRCVLSKFEFVILYDVNGLRTTVSKDLGSLNDRQNNYLRVDNKPSFTTRGIYLNATSKSIVEQLKRGTTLKTRFFEWSGEMYEETIPLDGFNEAYSFMLKAYAALR